MAELGTSLTNHPHLDVFSARSEAELLTMIKQIKLPFKIVSIYGLNGRHYAWLSLTRAVKKVSKTEIKNI